MTAPARRLRPDEKKCLVEIARGIKAGFYPPKLEIQAMDEGVRDQILELLRGKHGSRHMKVTVAGRMPAYGCSVEEMQLYMLTAYERAILDLMVKGGPEPVDALSVSAVDHLRSAGMALIMTENGVDKLAPTPAGRRAAGGLDFEDAPELEAV